MFWGSYTVFPLCHIYLADDGILMSSNAKRSLSLPCSFDVSLFICFLAAKVNSEPIQAASCEEFEKKVWVIFHRDFCPRCSSHAAVERFGLSHLALSVCLSC